MRRRVSFQLRTRKHLGEAATCLSSGDQMDNGEGSDRESQEPPRPQPSGCSRPGRHSDISFHFQRP